MIPVNLSDERQRREWDAAVRVRDHSMVVELERRWAEAMADVAALGGVSVDYLDALMRRTWSIPPGGGGEDE